MRTIAICNLKGGVGKTTTTFNLAASLAERGKSVLLIDCDPQGNLTRCFGVENTPGRASLSDVLRGQATVDTAAVRTSRDGIWIVPSSPMLDEINRRNLAGERVLLARLPETCDYTLLDCPAGIGVVLLNALTAADEILAPVQAKGLASTSITRLLSHIADLRERGNPALDLTGIIVNHFDARTRISQRVLTELRQTYGPLVMGTVIHESVSVSESVDSGAPVIELPTNNRSAMEFRSLAAEVLARADVRIGYFGAHRRTDAARVAGGNIAIAGSRDYRPRVAPALG